MEYSYTRRDLLNEPATYMYPPFEGWDFLEAYRASRLHVLGGLLGQLEPLHGGTRASRAALASLNSGGVLDAASAFAVHAELIGDGWSGDEAAGNGGQETAGVLRGMLACPAEHGPLEVNAVLRGLVRRFEVSKKLPCVMSPPQYGLKGAPLSQVEPYAQFACLVGLAGMSARDLRLVNCLLKACDLLCSQGMEALAAPLTAPAVALAIMCEMSLVGALWPEKPC